MANTLTEYLASQEELVQEAALALPHSFSQCTYPRGAIRQAVYLCKTCNETRGICSACSIACHTDHEQLELFPKRAFRCDCPTRALGHACTLHKVLEDVNAGNVYGQNFKGAFCRCGRPYNADEERETMIQCLACEDWLHESCLHLRERPSSREPSPAPPAIEPTEPQASIDNDDAQSEASSSGLPPPLITADDYEALVCGACVAQIPILQRWAGTPGVHIVMRDAPDAPWKVVDRSLPADVPDQKTHVNIAEDGEGTGEGVQLGHKRAHSNSLETSEAKRARTSPAPACLAPPENPVAQRVYAALSTSPDEATTLGAGDVFLTEGWRGRWCRCGSCLPQLETRPYLLEEEETYEPPEDPDSHLSLEELGMRALSRLPRDRAIDGIHAFNDMRDGLLAFLRPFAQEGKVVAEADIHAFFGARAEADAAARRDR
ncbi:hypothetical protein OF83DRAFT_1061113 [Amylostereum chailletii]|nr:hypothetical protein OF83DRAFT_1061113 [Amylostereum chailletii]